MKIAEQACEDPIEELKKKLENLRKYIRDFEAELESDNPVYGTLMTKSQLILSESNSLTGYLGRKKHLL